MYSCAGLYNDPYCKDVLDSCRFKTPRACSLFLNSSSKLHDLFPHSFVLPDFPADADLMSDTRASVGYAAVNVRMMIFTCKGGRAHTFTISSNLIKSMFCNYFSDELTLI